jgi:hypothetical protein
MQFLKILGEFFRRFEMTKLTKTIVEGAAPQDKAFTLWCSDLPGFGVYVLPTGNRSYFVDYRNAKGTRRRLTIGRHGALTAETARKLAVKVLGEAVRGEDPAEERLTQRKSITVKELCARYMSLAEKGLIMGKRSRPKNKARPRPHARRYQSLHTGRRQRKDGSYRKNPEKAGKIDRRRRQGHGDTNCRTTRRHSDFCRVRRHHSNQPVDRRETPRG